MLKIYSKGCEYALWILSSIPKENVTGVFRAKDLCRLAKVPESSARKVLQGLVDRGLLCAVPGPGGGYCFKQEPHKTTLLGFIRAVDGPEVFDQCVMGLPTCNNKHPCPIHKLWQRMKTSMIKELGCKTLYSMMK